MGECINYQTKELTRELASWGYGLGEYGHSAEHPKPIKPIEELIMEILTKNPDPRYILGIPVIIAKNKVDYEKLLTLAEQKNTLRRIGYLLEVTREVAERNIMSEGIEKYIEEAYALVSNLSEESLYPYTPKEKEIYHHHVTEEGNELAVKWKVFTWGGLETIKDKFELYNDNPSPNYISPKSAWRYLRKLQNKTGESCR